MSCKCEHGKSWHLEYDGRYNECQKEGCKCRHFELRDTNTEMASAGNWSVSQMEEVEQLKSSREEIIRIPRDFHELYVRMMDEIRRG